MGNSLKAIHDAVEKISEEIISWRRVLHQNPELSFKEHKTSDIIVNVLSLIPGLEIRRPTPTSVVGILHGDKPGKVIAIRADIDALPINEDNDLPYKSQNEGVMHACGHDGHVAILLATATVLSRMRHQFSGEIRFLFQHAEELPPGGAQEMVNKGVLEGVQYIFAGHLWSELPVGKIGVTDGTIMASPDNFKITIRGKGGHAAHPEQTTDPIVIGAQIVSNLQNIRSRLTNPLDPLVVSITKFYSGVAYNVIPESAYLEGTVRTLSPDLRQKVPTLIKKIVTGIGSTYDADIMFEYTKGYDPVINDQLVNSMVKNAVCQVFGADALIPFQPTMGGEDFSAFLKEVPGAFFMIGCGNPNQTIVYPHHHPRFNIDEAALLIGSKLYCAIALGLLHIKD